MADTIPKIRILILSESIDTKQKFGNAKYIPYYDIELHTGDINRTGNFHFSLFDYDISIIHITEPSAHTIGYYENLPKLLRDATTALQHGRTVICLPNSKNFRSKKVNSVGMRAYEWLDKLGVELLDNYGENIQPSQSGRAKVIEQYLRYATEYHQVVTRPEPTSQSVLAVVDGTNIVVGFQHRIGTGTLVVLPPPVFDKDNYQLVVSYLLDVAKRYYERNQRRVLLGDIPEWLNDLRPPSVKDINKKIQELNTEKSKYDQIEYVVYGTGDELEKSVALLLTDLGLVVEPQHKGANIDIKAKYPELGLGFAIEVTGIKGVVQKESDKIGQSWQYLSERAGSSEEDDRLIIVANTQYNINPKHRRSDSFSDHVVKLLGGNGVLLITTLQLYGLWKDVHENRIKAKDVFIKLHQDSGLFK